ncbi:MAG: TonB family protein [Pseudomonadota bacterium]
MRQLFKTLAAGNDTIRWTLTASVLAHLFLVLGISFVMPTDSSTQTFSPPLKITLVPPTDDLLEKNPDADVFAQINQQGDSDTSTAALLALGAPPPKQTSGQAPSEKPLTARGDQSINIDPESDSSSPEQNLSELTQQINLAYLNSQAQPRERFVSANTKESLFAPYIEKWRIAVEKVGNLNYPDAAKQQNLEGSLVLNVTVRSDGSIDQVRMLRSSGHKILDDGAERIVHLSAPFAAFSREMLTEVDRLHIVRTWKFGRNRLTSSPN